MTKKGVIVSVAGLVAGLAVIYAATSSTDVEVPVVAQNQQITTGADDEALPSESMSQPASGAYIDLADTELADIDAPYRVVFFKADWCLTCNALEADIAENAQTIPEDVAVIQADYDAETALKQRYDVRMQHTLVQIDSDSNPIKTWVLSPSLNDVLSRIERT
jgi:thiol:disulfide interchange protein